MRVVELVPNRRVEWECISTHRQSSPASVWTGTRFIFEVAEGAGSSGSEGYPALTTLDFRQTGYDERSEFFEFNTSAWGEVLQNLKRVVEAQRS